MLLPGKRTLASHAGKGAQPLTKGMRSATTAVPHGAVIPIIPAPHRLARAGLPRALSEAKEHVVVRELQVIVARLLELPPERARVQDDIC